MPGPGNGQALALCAALLGSVAAAAEPLPIDYFTRDDDVGLMQVSPDGEFLGAITGGSDLSALIFIDLATMKMTGGVRASGGDEIIGFDWVSDTRIVYYFGQRFPGDEFPSHTGEIFAVDRDGKRDEQLYGYRAGNRHTGSRLGSRDSIKASGELLSTLEADDDHILIVERPYKVRYNTLYADPDAFPRVARIDVYSGERDLVDAVPLSDADLIVDHDDQVRFAIGYDADAKLAVLWRPEPGDDWTEFSLPGFVDGTVVPHRFGADGHSVVFTGVATGDTVRGLYRVDLATRNVELLYRHPGVDIDRILTDLTDRSVIGAGFETDRPGYYWLDPDEPSARLWRMLEKAFPGKAIDITSTTRDGRLALVHTWSDVNPGDYYLFDVEEKHATYIQSARSWIDPTLMHRREPVVVTARDGRKLHGYFTRPREGDGPFPLVVLPHGGPHGIRDHWQFDWQVQLLASRGYAVLQINFRGSGGYGREFQQAGYGEWGAAMQDDVTDATRWAISEGLAEEGSVCIFGASYGAYAALMGVVREPSLYACAIGLAGVYDLELMYESGDIRRWRVGEAWLQKVLGDDPELLKRRSPVYRAGEIEAPVMLIHGRNDWRADFEHAVRMRKALERAGKSVEWVELSGEGHGVYDEETRKRVYEQLLAFLDRHLPAEPAVVSAATSPAN